MTYNAGMQELSIRAMLLSARITLQGLDLLERQFFYGACDLVQTPTSGSPASRSKSKPKGISKTAKRRPGGSKSSAEVSQDGMRPEEVLEDLLWKLLECANHAAEFSLLFRLEISYSKNDMRGR